MNFFVPYVKETEFKDILLSMGYESAKYNNGYIRTVAFDSTHPRFHAHLIFHEPEEFVVVQLHFDRFNHNESSESAVYLGEGIKRELRKIEQAVLYRFSCKAREKGIKKYGTVNIPMTVNPLYKQ